MQCLNSTTTGSYWIAIIPYISEEPLFSVTLKKSYLILSLYLLPTMSSKRSFKPPHVPGKPAMMPPDCKFSTKNIAECVVKGQKLL